MPTVAGWALVACGLACSACGGDPERANRLRADIDDRRTQLRADEARMREALEEPPAPTSACAVADELGDAVTVWGEESGEQTSARVAHFDETTAELRQRADTISDAAARRWLGRVSGPDWYRYELVVLATQYRAPAPRSTATTGTFEGGHVVGRAVVWDHREHEVVCAADVEAESSESMGASSYPSTASLEEARVLGEALEQRLRTDLLHNVRAASIAALGQR